MKLLTLLTLFMTSTILMASSSEYSYDAAHVNNSLEKLNLLEDMHKANPDKSFESLTSNEAFEGLTISKGTISNFANASDMPILPAFWWGCILSWVGILVVYLVTQDSSQTRSALWGCLIGAGAWIIVSLILGLLTGGYLFLWWL